MVSIFDFQAERGLGATYNLAIFADDESGRAALHDLLREKYGNYSIHRMIYKFAPPTENPTKKYEKLSDAKLRDIAIENKRQQ